MKNPRRIVAPILAALIAGSSLASAQTSPRQGNATPPANRQTQQQPPRGDRPAPGPLTVKYYNGNPLKGGTLISTATVQPQPGSAGDLFSNAPAGATYVAVSTPFGTRITSLKDAQARTPGGQRGGRVGDGQGAPPAGQNRLDGPRDRPDGHGLLPGLGGASSVTFYTADPLAGGQVQTTIQLSGAPTAQQQQVISQAVSRAKFAVIERGGETMIVNLSKLPGGAPNPSN